MTVSRPEKEACCGLEPLFRERAGGKPRGCESAGGREWELLVELGALVRRCSGLSLPEFERLVEERKGDGRSG